MGVGKSSVLAEASDILARRRVAHAAIDVDAWGLGFLPEPVTTDEAMYRNLRSVCGNYAALGVRRFLLARAIEGRAQLDLCRAAISGKNSLPELVVCRLAASVATMQQRVQMRETGIGQQAFVARVAELDVILDRVRLEDFAVANENRSLSDAAMEMLVKAGWISS